MKKQSFILAVAIATFTLTACGEKKQTPEELKMVAIKNGKEAMQEYTRLGTSGISYIPEKTIDSLLEIINKGRKETGEALIYTKKQMAEMGIDTSKAGRIENRKQMEKLLGRKIKTPIE